MTTLVDELLRDLIDLARYQLQTIYADCNECDNDEHLNGELDVLKGFGLASVVTSNNDMWHWSATKKLRTDLDAACRAEDVHPGNPTITLDVSPEQGYSYCQLFERVILMEYQFISGLIGALWNEIRNGNLARVVAADGRITFHQTPRAVFWGVRDKKIPYRSIFVDLRRRGLMRIARDGAGRRKWHPTAAGILKGLGAAEGAATDLLRNLGYVSPEAIETNRLMN